MRQLANLRQYASACDDTAAGCRSRPSLTRAHSPHQYPHCPTLSPKYTDVFGKLAAASLRLTVEMSRTKWSVGIGEAFNQSLSQKRVYGPVPELTQKHWRLSQVPRAFPKGIGSSPTSQVQDKCQLYNFLPKGVSMDPRKVRTVESEVLTVLVRKH